MFDSTPCALRPSSKLSRARWWRPHLIWCGLLLSACATEPPYQVPSVALGTQFKQAATSTATTASLWRPAQAADDPARGPWWQVFNDPVLNELQERLAVGNLDVQAAQAQVRQAQAAVRLARAGLRPHIDASLSASRSRSSSSAISSAPASPAATRYSADVSASWEADVWGRVNAQVDASQADAQAYAADLGNIRLTAQATLAQTYISLRMAERQAVLLAQLVEGDAEILQLTITRHAAGVVSRGDIDQAQTQLSSTQADLLEVGIQRAQLEHAVAVLLGLAPSELRLPNATAELKPAPIPATGLPSELLQRRPDIAAAERRVAAQYGQLRASRKAWFPSLTLGASLGARSGNWADLWSAPVRVWSLGPQLAASLLDGDARQSQTEQTQAAYEIAVAHYRRTVLGALEEVENQLAALRVYEREAEVQDEAVAAAHRALEVSLAQYRAGTVSAQNVVIARAAVSSAERSRVALQGRWLAASVSLIQALGGGWTMAATPP